jgi:predicted  nucleic acid-binding Zn-ribbon protein
MESKIEEMQQTIDALTKANAELMAWKQEYNSSKQSLVRMSTRLRKLCKRLNPDVETVAEMQKIADEIKALVKAVTAKI